MTKQTKGLKVKSEIRAGNTVAAATGTGNFNGSIPTLLGQLGM